MVFPAMYYKVTALHARLDNMSKTNQLELSDKFGDLKWRDTRNESGMSPSSTQLNLPGSLRQMVRQTLRTINYCTCYAKGYPNLKAEL